MPQRIRSVKPELWQDEALGRCPIGARLLYVGLFNQADDDGRFRAAPALLRAAIFPYDESLSIRRLAEWLGALADARKIRLYTARGESFGDVTNWPKHQKIDRPSPSSLPAFEQRDKTEQNGDLPGHSTSPREDSTSPREHSSGEGKGTEFPKEQPSAHTHNPSEAQASDSVRLAEKHTQPNGSTVYGLSPALRRFAEEQPQPRSSE